MPDTKAFVSYSWTTEQQNGIVDTLGELCTQRGITLIRDNKALKHGELIDRFMNELSKGDHVITVFSKPYFQSKWCMYELLSIYRRGDRDDFLKRTHPVIADDCNLQDQKYRLEVVAFWNEKFKEAELLVERFDPLNVQDELKEVELYRDIQQNTNKLMTFVAGRNTTPLTTLQQQNYAPLLDGIKLASNSVNQSQTQTVTNLLPLEPSQSKFLTQIKENISNELKNPAVAIFTKQLGLVLEAWLENASIPQQLDSDTRKIADALIIVLETGGDTVPVVSKVLAKVLNSIFNRDGVFYGETLSQQDKIEEITEKVLGWLVLASLDKTVVAEIKPAKDTLPAIYFEMPIQTAGGVETIVSYQYRRAAVWEAKSNDLPGRHMLTVDYNLCSWQDAETVSTLKLQLWNKVFSENRQIHLKPAEVNSLNARLKSYRETELLPAHYYFAIQCDNQTTEQAFQAAYKLLLKELPNLTLVRFGWAGDKNYFCVYEHDLMDAINLLLNNLRKIRSA